MYVSQTVSFPVVLAPSFSLTAANAPGHADSSQPVFPLLSGFLVPVCIHSTLSENISVQNYNLCI